MKITKRERKQYLKQIKKQLVCKGAQRKSFIDSFEDNIDEYMKANPEADFAQLQDDMGTPEEIANAFLENESASRIKKRMSIAKWFAIGIAAFVMICVCTITIFFLIKKNSHIEYISIPYTPSESSAEYSSD